MNIDAESSLETGLALIAAEMGGVPELDLHGVPTRLAPHSLDEFLQANWMRDEKSVRIVHGKGEGAVRKVVLDALRSHELVEDFRVHENGGSTAVAFVPRRA